MDLSQISKCICLKLQNTKNTVETAGGGEPVSLLQGSPLLMEYIRAGSTFQTKTPEHFIQILIRNILRLVVIYISLIVSLCIYSSADDDVFIFSFQKTPEQFLTNNMFLLLLVQSRAISNWTQNKQKYMLNVLKGNIISMVPKNSGKS